ncbi:MAG TPA: hypothetical protein EYQ75_20720 [Planctomycetaceae bacterium]|nr:hypothetical protein [Planctomycetaceae bacterium]
MNQLQKTHYQQQQVGGLLWVSLACVWLLAVSCNSLPSDRADVSIDAATNVKVVCRLFCGVVLCLLLASVWTHPKRQQVMRLCWPLVLFVGMAALSAIWSPLKTISLWQAGSLAVLSMLAMSLAVLYDSIRDFSLVMFHLSCVLLVNSGTVLAATFVMPSIGSLDRVSEGFFHTTSASASASLGLTLLVASALFWNWRWARLLLLPGAVVHCAVLYLAVNRVSILMTFIMLAVIFCYYSARSRTVPLVFVVLVSLTGSVYVGLDPGLGSVERLLAASSSYASRDQTLQQIMELSGRSEMWTAVWTEYLGSPWIGHGYFVCSPTGQIFVWNRWTNWTAHNVFLQCLMSVGLVGMLLLLWGFARVASFWGRCHARGVLSSEFSKLFVLLSIWSFGWGLFNESFLGPTRPQSIALFVLFGLAVGELVSAHSVIDDQCDGLDTATSESRHGLLTGDER